ncbi:MAG: AAA family ATPase [Chloroflexota bacterium]|nr:AAA family ATPase [Chloroflexota bacterium]
MICPRCGKENPAEAKFCLECGNSLEEATRPRREERKVVSVLFADLVGFTSQAERMDPEEVRAILQPYHVSLRADLERHGGTVEKFIGDAVMALFGAPVAHEDDPERAVRAALAIRETLANDGRLHVRIGITTGEALVALEARPESGEGMAAGDVVNTAARLQGVAPVDGILVDESTYRATKRAIEYREHAPVVVKGKTEPIAVREALSARARFGVDVRQIGQAPLVGRTREIELLAGALTRARDEHEPQLVTLVGVPGIGKSRVVWELFQQVDATPDLVAWRQGRSLPYAEGISYWALGEIVKAETGILETDSVEDARGKLARALAALSLEPSDAEWIERHLRPLIGLEVSTELRGDHRAEAFAAWRRYLEALAGQRPLVLVFEDLHWADDGLLDFLDHLVDWATGVPMLIVATSRPELLSRRPGWGGGKPNAVTISLSPLSDAEAGRLVASLVERAVIPASLREAVLDRAQGNPLYAEEFARLVGEGGRLDDLPETVQGIIAARLDALTRDEKELIQDAAVVGKVFWSGAVAQMRGGSRAEVEQPLHALERKEFVRREQRSSVDGETEYAFRHILVRDVAYGQIPRGERAERHAMAAEWIESLGRPADHAELLAQHYLSAIDLARAAGRSIDAYAARAGEVLRDAGDRASALNAFAPATRYYKAALDLTAPEDPDQPRLLFKYGKALWVSQATGADTLREAEAGLRAAGALDTAAEAAVLQAEAAWDAGDHAQTSEHLARAAALVKDLPDSFSKAYVLSDLSRYQMLAAQYDLAMSLGAQALAIAEALGYDEVRAHALNNIGTARAYIDYLGGVTELESALEIATAINSPEAARAMNNLASVLWVRGDSKRAKQLWRQAVVMARELGAASTERFVRGLLPVLDYSEGSWDTALRSFDEFIAEVEGAGGHQTVGMCRAYRGRIRFARGDFDGAREDAERGLAAGRRAQDPEALRPGLLFMAWFSHHSGRSKEAGALLDELLAQLQPGSGELSEDVVEVVLLLLALRRDTNLLRATMARSARWTELLDMIIGGDVTAAADLCDELGVLPEGALLRLHAARVLASEGRASDARVPLQKAVTFWHSVGATRFVDEAEELAATLGPVVPAARRKRSTAARKRP